MNALWVGMISAIQAIAVKLLTQKFFEAMLLIGLKKLAKMEKSPVSDDFVKEVAKGLGREDLIDK